MVTGEQVKQAMSEKGITVVDHHKCGLCGYMTKYEVINDDIYFDPGCYCTGGAGHELCGFQDGADWINMQSNPDVKKKLALEFGIEL